jgi:hypothetical protein
MEMTPSGVLMYQLGYFLRVRDDILKRINTMPNNVLRDLDKFIQHDKNVLSVMRDKCKLHDVLNPIEPLVVAFKTGEVEIVKLDDMEIYYDYVTMFVHITVEIGQHIRNIVATLD